MPTDTSAKILLLGKTGAGKSSFINYFIGKNVAETGAGEPVTKDYCIEYEFNNGRYPIKIFDSKGFEAKTAAEQKDKIISMVSEKNNSDDVFNWFHTIFYCSSAKSRFEDYEVEFIQDLCSTISQNIHIILTNCDGFDRQTLEEKKTFIQNKLSGISGNIHIFEVVSVSMKKRNGDIVVPRGKEEISSSVFRLLWQDISSKISGEYAAELHSSLLNSIDRIFTEFSDKLNRLCTVPALMAAGRDKSRLSAKINKIIDNVFDDIEPECKEISNNCNQKYNEILKPVSDLFISYSGAVTNTSLASFAGEAMLDFNSWFFGLFSNLEDISTDDILKKTFRIWLPASKTIYGILCAIWEK